MLPQWHMKDPIHSAKSACGKLELNTHTLLTQQSWSHLTMLSRHSVGVLSRRQAHAQQAHNNHAQGILAWDKTVLREFGL